MNVLCSGKVQPSVAFWEYTLKYLQVTLSRVPYSLSCSPDDDIKIVDLSAVVCMGIRSAYADPLSTVQSFPIEIFCL